MKLSKLAFLEHDCWTNNNIKYLLNNSAKKRIWKDLNYFNKGLQG